MSIVNFNNTTPAAPGGNTNVTFQQSGDDVSAYAPNAASPLTTKGDLFGYTTTDAPVPVGSDGLVLTADSGAAAGVSWQASGGSAWPLTITQEAGYTQLGSATTGFTITFPQAAQASGATMFCLVATDGSNSFTAPAGWTVDINQTEATYARFVLCHKASASDTSATFTSGSPTFAAVFFFECSGSHALDQSSSSGVANEAVVLLPAITPTAGSLVFGALCVVPSNAEPPTPSISSFNPAWRSIALVSPLDGGRSLMFVVGTGPAQNVSTTPPPISFGGLVLFASGGIAYSTFSIL